MRQEKCEMCRYFFATEYSMVMRTCVGGQCRRNPPEAASPGDIPRELRGGLYAVFPTVPSTYWCGEFVWDPGKLRKKSVTRKFDDETMVG